MDISKSFGYNFDSEKNVRQTRTAERTNKNGLPRTKRRKPPSRRRTKAKPRKNRPHENVEDMNLECCTERTCLLNQGRMVIRVIRNDFDSKLYEQQNAYLSSLIEINPKKTRNRITYYIRDNSGLKRVKVCKKAFLKILGIGKKRIAVLVKKIQPYSGDIQEDQRKFTRNEKKISLALKAEVVEHIRSYDREVSHYAREKTRDRQFLAANLSIAKIWREFIESKGLQTGSKLPLSYSSFRKIFRSFKLSFRKPYVDTCGTCDSFIVIMKHSKDEEEKTSAENLKAGHVRKADLHYDCIRFDLHTLTKLKNKQTENAWTLPPLWTNSNKR